MNDFSTYESADIVVVGAGLVGSLFVSEILDDFQKIALLDAGSNVHSSMKEVKTSGDFFHPSGDRYRCFGLGGSSSKWAGRCVIYDRQDFELSDQWPIHYDEIYKYYDRALKLLDAEVEISDVQSLVDATGELLPINQADFGRSFDIYSKPTNTYEKFSSRFNECHNLKIYHDHVVTSLDSCDDDYKFISGVGPDGRFGIRSKRVVLCTGGLEVTKLLLNLQHNKQITESSVLGSHYMTHYAGTIGDFRVDSSRINYGYGKKGNVFVRNKYLYKKKVKNDLSFTARIHFPDIDNPKHSSSILSFLYVFRKIIGYEYGLRLVKASMASNYEHFLNILLNPFSLFRDVYTLIIGRYFLDRKIPPLMRTCSKSFNLDIHCEQSPTVDSYVTLSDEVDDYGLFKLKVHWHPDDGDMDNLAVNIQKLIEQVGANCDYCCYLSCDEIKSELLRHGAFGGHFIGTTKMGKDSTESVVDLNLKLHGADDLYVLSSSVFPTSSHANPSLTIAALAVRLADYLKAER